MPFVPARLPFAALLVLGAAACSSTSTPSPATDTASDGGAAYPAGPYGLAAGDVFPNVTWQGELGGAGPVRAIASADYYDPTGKKGIRGVYFTVTVTGSKCPPCDQAAQATAAASAGPPFDLAKRGGRAVDILTMDWGTTNRPSTAGDIPTWVGAHGIGYDVVVDPAPAVDAGASMTSIGPFDTAPTSYIVDPRTMKIAAVFVGYTAANFVSLNATLVMNGATTIDVPDAGTD
jgi:hypothetical protein